MRATTQGAPCKTTIVEPKALVKAMIEETSNCKDKSFNTFGVQQSQNHNASTVTHGVLNTSVLSCKLTLKQDHQDEQGNGCTNGSIF